MVAFFREGFFADEGSLFFLLIKVSSLEKNNFVQEKNSSEKGGSLVKGSHLRNDFILEKISLMKEILESFISEDEFVDEKSSLMKIICL